MAKNKLKELRLSKNLTQTELAEILGVEQQDVSRWENDKNKPSREKEQMISIYFGEKKEDIFFGLYNTPEVFNAQISNKIKHKKS